MRVDAHVHYVPASVIAAIEAGTEWHGIAFGLNERGQPVSRIPGSESPQGGVLPWRNFRQTIDERLGVMDELRVDVQVLSLTPTLWRYELDVDDATDLARDVNDETGSIIERHPTRFAGFAALPLQDPGRAVKELERAVRECGLVGAGIGTHVNGEDWDSERLFPVLEAAAALDALLFVHPTVVRPRAVLDRYHLANLIGNPFETTRAIASLIFGGVLDRLPNLRICFAHAGGYAAFAAGRFDHGARVRPECRTTRQLPSAYLPHLYYDSISHSHSALRYLVDEVGADHVVLGSDYPADMGTPDPVASVEGNPLLSDSEKASILGANLEALLGRRVTAAPAQAR